MRVFFLIVLTEINDYIDYTMNFQTSLSLSLITTACNYFYRHIHPNIEDLSEEGLRYSRTDNTKDFNPKSSSFGYKVHELVINFSLVTQRKNLNYKTDTSCFLSFEVIELY